MAMILKRRCFTHVAWFLNSCTRKLSIPFPVQARAVFCFQRMVCAGSPVPFLHQRGFSTTNDFESMLRSAEQGNADAQYRVGQAFFVGKEVDRNPQLGNMWIEKAAAQNHPAAMLHLGQINMFQNPNGAIDLIAKSAKLGHAPAQFLIGKLHRTRDMPGIVRDVSKANEWFLKAAEGGLATAQGFIANYFYYGIEGFTKDYAKAKEWGLKAALQGDALGQVVAGFGYDFGHGSDKNAELALEWYRKAAEQDDTYGQFCFGDCLLRQEAPNVEQALHWIRKASEDGFLPAVFRLAQFTEEKEEKFKLMKQAADGGVAAAQLLVASMLLHGVGTAVDNVTAIEYLRSAARNNNSDAEYNLGTVYELGIDGIVKQDRAIALEWYRRAAIHGHVKGEWNVSRLLMNSGSTADFNEGVVWLQKAAEKGLAEAEERLGRMYTLNEHGISPSETLARQWFTRAAEKGDSNAAAALGSMCLAGGQYEEAFKWLSQAAALNHPHGMIELARMYVHGIGGIQIDLNEAMKWYLDAHRVCQNFNASESEVPVLHGLVDCFGREPGRWSEDTIRECVEIFERTEAANPSSTTQFALGLVCNFGLGRAKDTVLAKRWFGKAAHDGHPVATYNLGGYALDEGNLEEAVKWFEQSASLGLVHGKFAASEVLRELGKVGESKKWLREAAAEKFEPALARYRELYKTEDP